MSQTPKPVLKLNTTRAPSFSGPSAATPQTASDAPKIKLKLPGASQPPTPAPLPPMPVIKTKAGRAMKPTAKILESRKRRSEDLDDSEDEILQNRVGSSQPHKKIKILPTVTPGAGGRPKINIKHRKGEAPTRIHGEGYDSCASDNEEDPLIEEQVVFRMMPGPDCDYIRENLNNKRVPGQPDFDFQIKFLDNDARRVIVRVRSNYYAATLLELPTITETMKTFDRKAFVKSADICQILLVYARLEHENQINTVPLPEIILPGHKWPHGLTPPMHDCIKRRFRKAISKKEIQSKEDEVNRLLQLDEEFEESQYFVEKPDEEEEKADSDDDGERDAEGDIDDGYFGPQHSEHAANGDAEDMGDLEQMLLEGFEEQPDATGANDARNGQATGADLFGQGEGKDEDEDEADNDEDEEDDEDEDEDEEVDDAEDENTRAIIEDIQELKRQIEDKEAQMEKTYNILLKQRLKEGLKNLRNDLELKRASIGQKDAD